MTIYIDELESTLSAAFINSVTVELTSEPGIGKSTVLRQMAKAMARKLNQAFAFVVRHLSTMDPTEVAGPMFIGKRPILGVETECAINSYPALFPNLTDTVFLPDGTEMTIGEFGSIPAFGYVFLDELRQAPHDVQKPAARFLDEHRIGEWSLKQLGAGKGRWGVLAASNRTEDKSGVNRDLAFITNRKLVLRVASTAQILANYYEDNPIIHPICIGYIRNFPGSVFTSEVPKDDKPFATPRSFERAAKMLMTMGRNGEPLTVHPATEVASGLIGEGKGPEFVGYLKCHADMPQIADIIRDPKKAMLPTRMDVMWATTQLLIASSQEQKQHVMKFFEYIQRMPREMQLVGTSGITRKVEDLLYNREYVVWSAANKDLLTAAHAADRRAKR